MTHLLNYIQWAPDEVAFRLGSIDVRWYGLCWLMGLLLAYLIVRWLFIEQKIDKRTVVVNGVKKEENIFDPLFFYCFLGIIIGARLGHCFFYEPSVYLSSWDKFIEIFIPMEHTAEGWKYTGYEGLASHGGTIGLMIALFLYYRKTRLNLWTVLDNIAIATPVTACFIRLGNLMNSEIIGKVTDVPWAFVFVRSGHDYALAPRHPGQLYEAICYAIFFFVIWFVYKKRPQKVGSGFFFGLCLTLIFTARFFIEFTKIEQVAFENGMPLNMGQLLSIPFIMIGIVSMKGGKWMKKIGAKP